MFVLPAIQMFARHVTGSVTSLGLQILLIGLAKATVVDYCGVFCTSDGQKKGDIFCPTYNGTTNERIYCCGSNMNMFCCSDPMQKTTSPSNSCARMKYDWIIIITIVMTVVVFLLGLTGCLCLCQKKCGCKNVVFSETGEQQSLSESPIESAAHPLTASDFDPTSPCAFAPPAYDSLPKDPPVYSEIFTISTGCNHDSPSNTTQTNSHLVSECNAMNRRHPLPVNSTTETVPRGSSQSRPPSALDLSPPYPPDDVSSNPPPSYSSRPSSRVHRPSLSLAIELHPLNLRVTGSLLSSPTEVGVPATTV